MVTFLSGRRYRAGAPRLRGWDAFFLTQPAGDVPVREGMDTPLIESPPSPFPPARRAGPRSLPAPRPARVPLEPAGWQWLPVSAHIRERYLVTFRAPAAAVARLVPAPLTVDSFRGHGFVSVCALEMDDMGVAGTPSWLRFSNLEFLYRVGVRAGGAPS